MNAVGVMLLMVAAYLSLLAASDTYDAETSILLYLRITAAVVLAGVGVWLL